MILLDEIIEGIFVEENKNRFLCKVIIQEKICECYVPSASRLQNYIKLEGKQVLLKRNTGSHNKTDYSVFAVKYYGKYVLLNLSIVNTILQEYINDNYKHEKVEREKVIGSYKSDFLILGERKIIVEAKGIISTRREMEFPTVYSSRAIEQLKNISKFIDEGYEAQYFYISLSPILKLIKINHNVAYLEYYKLLSQCVKKGMLIKAFNISYCNNKIEIGTDIKVVL